MIRKFTGKKIFGDGLNEVSDHKTRMAQVVQLIQAPLEDFVWKNEHTFKFIGGNFGSMIKVLIREVLIDLDIKNMA